MGNVMDLLRTKGIRVLTVTPDVTVFEATARMNAHKCGAVVVVSREQPGNVVGIFTERDVLQRVVGELRYADLVSVAEVMTRDVTTCDRLTAIAVASQIMHDHRIRHLPVVDQAGELCGLVSIGDINAWHVHMQQSQIEQLCDYIGGRG